MRTSDWIGKRHSYFEEVVNKQFIYLVDQYGFSISDSNKERVYFENKKLYFDIYWYVIDKKLGFELGLLPRRINNLYSITEYSILWSLNLIEIGDRVNPIVEKEELENKVKYYAELLKGNAQQALLGAESYYAEIARIKGQNLENGLKREECYRAARDEYKNSNFEEVVRILKNYKERLWGYELELYNASLEMIHKAKIQNSGTRNTENDSMQNNNKSDIKDE